MIAATAAGQWKTICDAIDEGDVSRNTLSSLISCLTKMALTEQESRSNVMEWLRSRLERFIKDEDESPECIAFYVSMACDLWPGECIEEIRELFGLQMVDTLIISIDCVLEAYEKNMEEFLSDKKESFLAAPFIFLVDPNVNEEELAD